MHLIKRRFDRKTTLVRMQTESVTDWSDFPVYR
jgi:hypothetical protein